MRRLALLILLTLTITVPLHAAGRQQSYFTYDEGGTIVRQGDEGREIEARVNLPVFPGDEVITNRRGRAEIRLADGSVIGIDRATAIRFRSILDSYDGDSSQTIVQLRYGHVVVQRTEYGRESVRLDTENASYIASNEAIYAIETDRGRDRVSVFDGNVEVRTPNRTSQVRAGEQASVDDSGVNDLVSQSRYAADDFERWFLRRTERYGRGSSRYLDRSIAYADYDLAEYGSWTYVSGFGTWGWRPYVSLGWRPYYHGHWIYGPSGCLVWVSYEPWGWVPYHYGRWGYDPFYGWVWLPGAGYAPAWVYWMYTPGYIAWAPAGWFDAYRPYYNWCYRPYTHVNLTFGFGFYGRVRINEIDLRPWTFVTPNTLISTRVDRAALTTDAIRSRLARDTGGLATVSNDPARFTRPELRDPAAAVNNIARRGLGSGTGKEGTGSSADMTPFFRRDPELSNSVRERIIRTRPADSGQRTPSSGGIGGIVAPSKDRFGRDGSTREGSVIDRGGIRRGDFGERVDRSGSVRRGESGGGSTDRGGIRRGDAGETSGRSGVGSRSDSSGRDGGTLRRGDADRSGSRERDGGVVQRPRLEPSSGDQPSVDRTPERPRDDSWRGRAVGRGGSEPRDTTSPRSADVPRTEVSEPRSDRGSDIPRRIIDRIGGARIYPSDGGRSGSARDSAPPRVETPRSETPRTESPRPEHSSPPPSRERPSHEGGRVKRDG